MLDWIKKNGWKIFGIAWLLNTAENLFLLYYFNISIGKSSIISSLIFALTFMLLYKLLEGKLK